MENNVGQIKDLPVTELTAPIEHVENLSVKTDTEKLSITKNELPVKTDSDQREKNHRNKSPECVKEQAYTTRPSRFVMEMDRLYSDRDLSYSLSKFFDAKDEAGVWVSERYRCLLEVLLTFSELKRIELDDLKEVCNAFTSVINSKYFKYIHPSYPYIDEIKKLREQIRNTCVKTIGEQLKYRLIRDQKQKLIVARCELSQFVPRKKFSELKFKE
ncbi:MAG: hypothetical protein IT281_03335 [Ignavibacteria bacterium]|nr:hypothetical protein [Ignavibacteria bacterium]